MNTIDKIKDCYNKVAAPYAVKFFNELNYKQFDRIILAAFAKQNTHKGTVLDLGCGPGQTTNYLHEQGCTNIVGIDISQEMIKIANRHLPHLNFRVDNFFSLHYQNNSIGSIIAFYAIVNLTYDELSIVLKEISRVLKQGGEFLFSFHVGDAVIHYDNFFDTTVDIDFRLFDVAKVKELLADAGFRILDLIVRAPYNMEYQTERAYIWVAK